MQQATNVLRHDSHDYIELSRNSDELAEGQRIIKASIRQIIQIQSELDYILMNLVEFQDDLTLRKAI